jgi:tetratricopeptide (TPR) repeat protein
MEMERALAYFREIDYPNNVAYTLWELGRIRLSTGRIDTAQALFEEALELFESRGYRFGQAYLLYELGRVRLARDEPNGAAQWLRRSIVVFREVGNPAGEGNAVHELGRARLALGGLNTARLLLDRALRLSRDVEDPQAVAEAYNSKGLLERTCGDARRALGFHLEALETARRCSSLLDEARALDGAAESHAMLGERQRARDALREAVALYQRMNAAEEAGAVRRLVVLADLEA